MPNCVRGEIFTEFAMETARDSIKYVRPVYSKPASKTGSDMKDRVSTEEEWDRRYDDADGDYNSINGEKYRKAIYESTEDRISQELSAVAIKDGAFTFKDAADAKAVTFGKNGEKYIDGYVVIYDGDESNVVAIQDKRTKKFFVSPEYAGLSFVAEGNVVTMGEDSEGGESSVDTSNFKAFGRFNSEDDFEGDNLGEVEIKMSDYFFEPRPTTIGVTWSQLSELVLDTSYNVSAEEYLVTYAAQAIRMHLDYAAIKLGYRYAKTNPAGYFVTFDAGWDKNTAYTANAKRGYIENCQTFLSAISTVGDNMLNDIKQTNSVISRRLDTKLTALTAGNSRQFETISNKDFNLRLSATRQFFNG